MFLFTSTQQMDAMLKRANQGKLTTAIAVKQLWDAHRTNWMEVRRLEIELGEGGDHDQPYDGDLTLSSSQTLAWTTLLAKRVCGELLQYSVSATQRRADGHQGWSRKQKSKFQARGSFLAVRENNSTLACAGEP